MSKIGFGGPREICYVVLMYIRIKKNKSGSFSIQVVEKRKGIRKVIETIGVSAKQKARAFFI